MTMTLRAQACAIALSVAALAALPSAANALKAGDDEKANLKACEARLCATILDKAPKTGTLACDLKKTWEKSKIVDGVKEKRISWTFGDAQCGVSLKLANDKIVSALTEASYELEFDPHQVSCKIERTDSVTDVQMTLKPKIAFKDGKAEKAWLNVSKIEAPTMIKGAIWTVSRLEDNFGLFHGQMISEINEFMHEKCAKRYRKKS